MKKEEIKKMSEAGKKGAKAGKKLREDIKNCFECSHREVCEKFLTAKSNVFKNRSSYTLDTVKNLGVDTGCEHFYYRKYDRYQLDDFKDLLKRRVDNSTNARHLLVIDSIFKLLEADKWNHMNH